MRLSVPETLRDEAARFDAQEGVVCRGLVKERHLGVGEERIGPPDTIQHLVTYTQLVLPGRAEVESSIVVGDLE